MMSNVRIPFVGSSCIHLLAQIRAIFGPLRAILSRWRVLRKTAHGCHTLLC